MTMAVARAVVAGSRPGTATHLSALERTAAEKDAQSALSIPIPTASHKASSSLGSWSTRIGRSGCVAMRSGLGWRAAEFNGAESLAPRTSVQIALGEGTKLSEKEEGRRRRRIRGGPIITARAESLWPPTRATSMAVSSLSEQETAVHVVDAPLSPSPSELSLPKREGLITIGLPKGSLQQATADLFLRAGYNIKIHERSYLPDVDDKEINVVLFRGQEISRYVEDGVLDAGICGHDWVVENGSDVTEVCELNYSKATASYRPRRFPVNALRHSGFGLPDRIG
ncbi:hypothetical protein CBR_g40740 [Chara braunii]|uniref:ATP phosphoribosyltransferase n=1 Tax=Chara braunii TaxID=69332 RepID=A0A388LUD2_CHABU|nr:hypothetical protein CBR_g40740 [Chara braunii]|eukprot:GBG85927.1 hypothetical protein CBR_g40740 [Chara braunii]